MQCVRSICLPSNRVLMACNLAGCTLGLFFSVCWDDPISAIVLAGGMGWSGSWAVLCAARSAQERLEGMDPELREDRRVLGLSLVGIPAGLISASMPTVALSLTSIADVLGRRAWRMPSETG